MSKNTRVIILSILAVVELGFGNAIIYHLYKPLAEKNEKEINLLIKFYKKTYNVLLSCNTIFSF